MRRIAVLALVAAGLSACAPSDQAKERLVVYTAAEADQITAEDRRALYDFRISAQEQVLMTGRAAAVFDVAVP